MTFSRVKALGYAFGELLPSADINQLDLDHSLAVDSRGGAYAITSGPLSFSGGTFSLTTSPLVCAANVTFQATSNFYCNAPSFFNLQLTANAAVVLNGTLDVSGFAAFAGDMLGLGTLVVAADVQAGSLFSGGTLDALGLSTLSTLMVTGASTLSGNAQLLGATNTIGHYAAGDILTVHSNTSFTGNVAFSTGQRFPTTGIIGTNANTTYSSSNSVIHFRAADLTANRSATISDSGAVDGDEVLCSNLSTTYFLTVFLPGGSSAEIGDGVGASGHTWVTAKRISGSWYFISGGSL